MLLAHHGGGVRSAPIAAQVAAAPAPTATDQAIEDEGVAKAARVAERLAETLEPGDALRIIEVTKGLLALLPIKRQAGLCVERNVVPHGLNGQDAILASDQRLAVRKVGLELDGSQIDLCQGQGTSILLELAPAAVTAPRTSPETGAGAEKRDGVEGGGAVDVEDGAELLDGDRQDSRLIQRGNEAVKPLQPLVEAEVPTHHSSLTILE